MPQSFGTLANRTGRYWRYIASAARRALATAAWSEAGRIGSNSDTLSSLAKISDAMRRKAGARSLRERCAVERYDSTNTLISTKDASGAGNSETSRCSLIELFHPGFSSLDGAKHVARAKGNQQFRVYHKRDCGKALPLTTFWVDGSGFTVGYLTVGVGYPTELAGAA